jgi:dTDP-4-dehydrorhamnose reductase
MLTGPTGQVGGALRRLIRSEHELIALDRQALDLSRPAAIEQAVASVAPDVVINAAAYTAVDAAEREPALAHRLNVEAPERLARAARRCGAVLVHYSSDYVFGGRAQRPYRPDDPPAPLSVYGQTKLDGELAVREAGGPSLILRASWVYAERGRNFLLTMLRLAERQQRIRVVDDQIGSPTAAAVVAGATLAALAAAVDGHSGARGLGGREGVYHVACAGTTSWYGFARAIFEIARVDPPPVLVPIPTSEYPTAATRPHFSALDTSSFETTFGVRLPPWRAALEEVMRRLDLRAAAEGPS